MSAFADSIDGNPKQNKFFGTGNLYYGIRKSDSNAGTISGFSELHFAWKISFRENFS